MAAGKYSFVIEQGATLDFEVQYKDSSGDPIDLTDYSGRLQIRSTFAQNNGELFLTLSSSRNPDGTGLILVARTEILLPHLVQLEYLLLHVQVHY